MFPVFAFYFFIFFCFSFFYILLPHFRSHGSYAAGRTSWTFSCLCKHFYFFSYYFYSFLFFFVLFYFHFLFLSFSLVNFFFSRFCGSKQNNRPENDENDYTGKSSWDFAISQWTWKKKISSLFLWIEMVRDRHSIFLCLTEEGWKRQSKL